MQKEVVSCRGRVGFWKEAIKMRGGYLRMPFFMSWKMPGFLESWLNVPRWAILPLLITMISSQFCMVVNLWAIDIIVVP